TTSAVDRGNTVVGNPELKPEHTNQYDVSYSNQLTDDFAFEVSAYYKDIVGQTGLSYYPDNRYPYLKLSNGEYGNVRGLEIAFRKRLINNFAFDVNYTLQSATGTSSNVQSNYNYIINSYDPFTNKRLLPLTESPLDFDRRNRINANLGLVWGSGEGPSI